MNYSPLFLIAVGLFTTACSVFCQDLSWNTGPPKGFVFQITNKEAQKLLTTSKPDTTFKNLLRHLIDTFDVKTGWIDRPAKGHFILATIQKNKLHYEYTSVFPYQVFLLREFNALALQVLDLDGKIRTDAKVKLGSTRVLLDTATNTYRMTDESFTGSHRFATLELNGFRSVFRLEKHEAPSWNYDYAYDSEDGPDFYSYMITDKNRYKPNEYLRFKSYALSGGRTPLRKDLEMWILSSGKPKKLGRVSPQRPGSYASQFLLHDSLKLPLDQFYSLQLRERTGRVVASCSFRFEDYELFGNNLQIELKNEKQYHPADNELTVKATDVNGLILKDASAEIILTTTAIRETFDPVVILPDTLFRKKIALDPESPTVVAIAANLFGKANVAYGVDVVVTNSENQRTTESLSATYYHAEHEIVSRFSNDSIIYELLSSGKPQKNISAKIIHGSLDSILISLPYKEKINPVVPVVKIESKPASRIISMNQLIPTLEIRGGIEKDSFKISLNNPQRLEVSWFVYQGDELLGKGSGSVMEYKSAITDRSRTFYVELLYSFGGQENIQTSEYPFRDDQLTVSLEMPERVYPGQTAEALIKVEDQKGNPVSNVDVTAFAVTSKLGYYPPALPYYGSVSDSRGQGTSFSKNDVNKRTAVLNLDYKKWAKIARLDTMKFYQFAYPAAGKFKHAYAISDSTQFAPYVMRNGSAQRIYVIEVNRTPVYFSWVTMPPRYSFYISPTQKHQITLRLYDRVLVLDSMQFAPGTKTLLSLDLDHLPEGIQVTRLYKPSGRHKNRKPPQFTPTEIDRYTRFIAGFKTLPKIGFLESNTGFIPLFENQFREQTVTVGPISPGRQTFSGQTNLGDDLSPISYLHQGGFNYQFEDNIVYKTDAKDLIPDRLIKNWYDPSVNLADLVLTKKEFLERTPEAGKIWHARSIELVDQSMRLSLLLPEELAKTGIASVLLEECKTGSIISPCLLYSPKSGYYLLPRGCHNIIVLYNSGWYFRADGVELRSFAKVVVNYNQFKIQPADNKSREWLQRTPEDCFKNQLPSARTYQIRTRKAGIGNVRGVVLSTEDNSPLPGVNVLVKGTMYGTVTDENGQFALTISESPSTLVISFIGFQTQEIEVQAGSVISVALPLDVMQLSEVVVVGYGVSSEKRSLSSSLLQGRAAGVQIAELADETAEMLAAAEEPSAQERREAEQRIYQELLNLKSIRSNFSDVGFWEPSLFTDRAGESRFEVKFPDNITRWDATVYAMNRRLQTGTARRSIKSYKPIMAEFHVPQFLTRGDSAAFLGKVVNYSQDSTIRGKVNWKVTNEEREQNISLQGFYTEKFYAQIESTDTLKGSFVFTRDDGYLDGEEREVAVVEQGIIRANGTVEILKGNDVIQVKAPEDGQTIVEILDNPMDVWVRDVEDLLNYRYTCNEQLASKLIALVNYMNVMQFKGERFKYDRDVNRIIARLLKNQNQEFLWSWWDVSANTSPWMSAHILRALKAAQDAGYTVGLDIQNLARKASFKYESQKDIRIADADLLNALATWGIELNYAKLTRKVDSLIYQSQLVKDKRTGEIQWMPKFFIEKLLLLEVKQRKNIPFSIDSLLRYKQEGILADVSFADGNSSYSWFRNELAANAVAYRIVKQNASLRDLMMPMQLYFLKERRKNTWNTYHSSSVLLSIFPDFLEAGARSSQVAKVKLTGKANEALTKFPYRIQLAAGEALQIDKLSGVPLYVMKYDLERVTVATAGVDGLSIRTAFRNHKSQLVAGQPVELVVDVDVKKDASMEYVMIEVPIPASCSYNDKRQNARETHREYFKEKTVIFCENLKAGVHSFTISLLPRFTGKYFQNPAQVSLMYVPVVNANTALKTVNVH